MHACQSFLLLILSLVVSGVHGIHRAEPGAGPGPAQAAPAALQAGRLQAGHHQAGRIQVAVLRAGLLHAGRLGDVLGPGGLEAGGGEGEERGGLVGEVCHVAVGLAPPPQRRAAGGTRQPCTLLQARFKKKKIRTTWQICRVAGAIQGATGTWHLVPGTRHPAPAPGTCTWHLAPVPGTWHLAPASNTRLPGRVGVVHGQELVPTPHLDDLWVVELGVGDHADKEGPLVLDRVSKSA